MRLRDFFRSSFQKSNEKLDDEEIKYILIEIPEELSNFLVLESYWKDSGFKDYMIRLDPENLNIPHKRHVHIAKRKHINSKSQQVSWNVDGSRHDKSSFNEKIVTKQVLDVARKALKLDDNITLESISLKNKKARFQLKTINVFGDHVFMKVFFIRD